MSDGRREDRGDDTGDADIPPDDDAERGEAPPGYGVDDAPVEVPDEEPADLPPAEIDRTFELLEEAVVDEALEDRQLDRLLSVLESAVAVPSETNPEAIAEITDPGGSGIDRLFPVPGLTGVDPEDIEDDATLGMFRMARIGAAMTQRATGYSIESGVRTGTRMAYAASTSESPAELLTEMRAIALDELQRAGIDVGEERVDWLAAHQDRTADRRPVTRESLRKRGTELLSKSAEIGRDETLHPAFPSILDQLAADEARILRLLGTEGRQPSMDVRDKGYIPFRSTVIAENLTRMGSDAGCRHPDRTPIYLQNLERLGLIAFSDEPIENLKQYQVLEAQPHIEEAREKAKRPKTVYGSIHLTDLGVDFCRTCLPFEVTVDYRETRLRKDADN
jgi:hypothetical protein